MIKILESDVFPTTREAIEWAMGIYSDKNRYHVDYRMMHGVGTRAIIYKLEELKCPFPDDIRDEILVLCQLMHDDPEYKSSKTWKRLSSKVSPYVLSRDKEAVEWIDSIRPRFGLEMTQKNDTENRL